MSEPTPLDLPVGLRWVKLVCRLGKLVSDSAADDDAHPDLLPVGGTLKLTASPNRVRVQEADGQWRSVEVAGRTYKIRADGELVDNEGRVGVWIPDPASLLVEPQGYALTAVVKPSGGTEWSVPFGGDTVLPDVVDLVAVSPVGPVSPTVTASFDARLHVLEAADAGKADADHGHVITDVTGLQAELDGKQAAGSYAAATHQHTVADLTDYTAPDLSGYATAAELTSGLSGKANATHSHAPADITGTAVITTDPRLADARTPTAHDHAITDVTGLQTALDGKQAAGSYAAATHDHDGTYAPALGPDDNYISDAEKAALHTHPAVIAQGDTAAAARAAIGAGTSNLALGTTSSTAKAGNYAPPSASTTVQGVVELATTAEATTGTDTSRAVTPAGVKAVADTKANASHSHTAAQVSGLATVATTGSYADLTGTPTIPDSPDVIGAAPATHDHTAADIDSGAATDGHVLTADGAGGTAWGPAAVDTIVINGDATLPSGHRLITILVTDLATLSIADAPDGTIIAVHVFNGWEKITWAPGIVVDGESSTSEAWLMLGRFEGAWSVFVAPESADSGGGDSGGGSIAGLNVITGSWPPPLTNGEYPAGTLFVRDPHEYSGPVMAVLKNSGGWAPLAADDVLSWGEIDADAFTAGIGQVLRAEWYFGGAGSDEAFMVLALSEVPENGDILCTFDPSTLTGVERNCLEGASGALMGVAAQSGPEDLLGAHHLTIDPWEGVVKYLWSVGGAPLAVGDVLMITWPVTIHSDYWETGRGGVAT